MQIKREMYAPDRPKRMMAASKPVKYNEKKLLENLKKQKHVDIAVEEEKEEPPLVEAFIEELPVDNEINLKRGCLDQNLLNLGMRYWDPVEPLKMKEFSNVNASDDHHHQQHQEDVEMTDIPIENTQQEPKKKKERKKKGMISVPTASDVQDIVLDDLVPVSTLEPVDIKPEDMPLQQRQQHFSESLPKSQYQPLMLEVPAEMFTCFREPKTAKRKEMAMLSCSKTPTVIGIIGYKMPKTEIKPKKVTPVNVTPISPLIDTPQGDWHIFMPAKFRSFFWLDNSVTNHPHPEIEDFRVIFPMEEFKKIKDVKSFELSRSPHWRYELPIRNSKNKWRECPHILVQAYVNRFMQRLNSLDITTCMMMVCGIQGSFRDASFSSFPDTRNPQRVPGHGFNAMPLMPPKQQNAILRQICREFNIVESHDDWEMAIAIGDHKSHAFNPTGSLKHILCDDKDDEY